INRIQRIDSAVRFCVEFPETTRAINFIDGRADDNAEAIFKLYKRHADEIGEALDSQGRQAFPRLRRRELPSDCLLSISAAGLRRIPGVVENIPPTRQDSSRWITATQAVELSEKTDRPVSASVLSKKSRDDPPPFKSRPAQGGRARLEIEKESFLK